MEHLQELGIHVSVDRHGIAAGSAWSSEIVQSIRGCAALLIACTPSAIESRNVRQEIQLAWKYNRPYVPLILEPTDYPPDVEYQLEGCPRVDLLDHGAETWTPPLLQPPHLLGAERLSDSSYFRLYFQTLIPDGQPHRAGSRHPSGAHCQTFRYVESTGGNRRRHRRSGQPPSERGRCRPCTSYPYQAAIAPII